MLGTGSAGNCYVLQAGGNKGQSLLLDAGLPIQRMIREADGWDRIFGCLITHEHQDHVKSALDVARLGIPTYATNGTIEAALGNGVLRAVEMIKPVMIGDFRVMAFEVEHDAKEPCGWLIEYTPTGEKSLYATDTYYLRYTFPGVHYWIVECNYLESMMQEQQEDGALDAALRQRLMRSHMSLRRLCDALQANDLTETRTVILIHLSDSRSDERTMVNGVKAASGIDEVYAASTGETYDMTLVPF